MDWKKRLERRVAVEIVGCGDECEPNVRRKCEK